MIAGWIVVLACLLYAVGPAVLHQVRPPQPQERRCEPLQASMVRSFRVEGLDEGGTYRFQLTSDGLQVTRFYPPYDWAREER